jgi:uncharacterized protein YndB with AHSA1/START domain
MKQSNQHFSYSIHIDNSIEKVWESLIDVERWPIWDTELLSAKLEGSFTNGAKGEMKPKTGPKLKYTISDVVPMQNYTINVAMPVGGMLIKRTLHSEGSQVVFTDDIQFTGILKGIFGLMLGGQFRKVLPEVLDNFKNMAERS